MDVHDTLKIKVVEARDLLMVNSAPPNPFLEILVGQSKKRSKVAKETNNPRWQDKPIVFEHILGDNVDSIVVYVKHKNSFSDIDPNIGLVIIPLDTFYGAPKVEVDRWYNLMQTVDMIEQPGASCQLRLQIEYNNEADEDLPPNIDADAIGLPNLLQVTIHSASDLAVKSAIEGFVEVQVQDLRKQTKVLS
jgi:hypothetical protein